MNLHNTRTKQVEAFNEFDKGIVRIYSCGPTVYDQVHIGNLSSFIYADLLRRAFSFSGYKIKHVMNFTDVDDKTIRRSLEQYGHLGPEEALRKLTQECSDQFLEDMTAVSNDVDSMIFVRATDYIKEMQRIITELLDKKFAYIADDGIYFSIDKYRKSDKVYGQLSEITADTTSEARIQNDEYDKASIHDFALWKKQKPSEPAWDFIIEGKNVVGRPGWHIECSAMSHSLLGQPFDIHTGGVDLIFPHHENEIAQSTAGKDDPLYANFFVHNEHMLVNDQKMSKSLNNFLTLNDIRQKQFSPIAFRLLVLQSHYRSQVHFSWDLLEAAQNRLQDLYSLSALRWQGKDTSTETPYPTSETFKAEFEKYITDDLNTPQLLAYLSEKSGILQNSLVATKNIDDFKNTIQYIDQLLGLNLMNITDIDEEYKRLISKRDEKRRDEKWTEADTIRKELEAKSIGIRDTDKGTIWYPLIRS